MDYTILKLQLVLYHKPKSFFINSIGITVLNRKVITNFILKKNLFSEVENKLYFILKTKKKPVPITGQGLLKIRFSYYLLCRLLDLTLKKT